MYKILYMTQPQPEKPMYWIGSSLDDLKEFPADVKKHFGFELHAIQHGTEPAQWKPIPNWGTGVIELKYKDSSGAYRVVYVAKFRHAIYILHSFQKKTQQTAKPDVEIIKARYKEIALLEEQYEQD